MYKCSWRSECAKSIISSKFPSLVDCILIEFSLRICWMFAHENYCTTRGAVDLCRFSRNCWRNRKLNCNYGMLHCRIGYLQYTHHPQAQSAHCNLILNFRGDLRFRQSKHFLQIKATAIPSIRLKTINLNMQLPSIFTQSYSPAHRAELSWAAQALKWITKWIKLRLQYQGYATYIYVPKQQRAYL